VGCMKAITIAFCSAALLALFSSCGAQEPSPTSPGTTTAISLHEPVKDAHLNARLVRLREPVVFIKDGQERRTNEVLEFAVTAAQQIPVRALDPVLWVGDIPVREYRYANEDRTLVFTLFEPAKVRDQAPVHLQFGNDEATRTKLGAFRGKAIKRTTR
jgi:hypothetical protein